MILDVKIFKRGNLCVKWYKWSGVCVVAENERICGVCDEYDSLLSFTKNASKHFIIMFYEQESKN